jgi:hypothetical protein
MRFDTFMDAELEVERLEACIKELEEARDANGYMVLERDKRIAELERALDSLHRGVTKGSCCEPSAYDPESHDGGG